MYIIQDKKTNTVLYNSPTMMDGLSGEEVYAGFDPKTMRLLINTSGVLPEYFKADKDGFVVEKTFEEKVKDKDLSLQEIFRFDPDREAEKGKFDPLAFCLKEGRIKSSDDCSLVLGYLTSKFEYELAQQYSPGYETKLLKEYIAWMAEGKSAKDSREKNYIAMQTAVAELKKSDKPIRDKVKKLATVANKKK